MFQSCVETISHGGVNNKINRSIDDKQGVVHACQTQIPVGRHKSVWTIKHLIHKKELSAVQDDSGDVTDEEHCDDADEDGCKIQLSTDSSVSGFLVSVPRTIYINKA